MGAPIPRRKENETTALACSANIYLCEQREGKRDRQAGEAELCQNDHRACARLPSASRSLFADTVLLVASDRAAALA